MWKIGLVLSLGLCPVLAGCPEEEVSGATLHTQEVWPGDTVAIQPAGVNWQVAYCEEVSAGSERCRDWTIEYEALDGFLCRRGDDPCVVEVQADQGYRLIVTWVE